MLTKVCHLQRADDKALFEVNSRGAFFLLKMFEINKNNRCFITLHSEKGAFLIYKIEELIT